MTRPGYSPPTQPGFAGPPRQPSVHARRRWWLVAITIGWVVVLAGLSLWSARHDPPTVPEQRDIAQALPVLTRATSAVLAAADGPGRAVRLEALRVDRGCRLTPVRAGMEATRDVTVFVPADQARAALDAIAKGLPPAYRAHVTGSGTGARVSLHADAGSYVALDADVPPGAQVFTVEVSTGCRPPAALDPADPRAGDPPPALADAERAFHGSGTPNVSAVACADGRTAATYTVDGLPRTGDLGRSLEQVTAGAAVVLSDPAAWAYRSGDVSVVVNAGPASTRVSATTPCH